MGAYKNQEHDRRDARKTDKSPKGKAPTGYPSIHWARVSFSPDQKLHLSKTELDVLKFWDTLTSLIESGHKLVINPKNEQGFIGISCIGVWDECPNKNCGISGEGGNFDKAVRSIWFKMDLLDYQWFPSDDGTDTDFR